MSVEPERAHIRVMGIISLVASIDDHLTRPIDRRQHFLSDEKRGDGNRLCLKRKMSKQKKGGKAG